MSVSLSKIEAFANRALAKPPSDWESAVYPAGKHLWTDVFNETYVKEIAKVVGQERADEVHDLRLLLVFAADDVVKSFRLIGGPAAPGQKRDWAEKVIQDGKRLRISLQDAGGSASASVRRLPGVGKTVRQLVPGSAVEAAASKVVASIDELLALIEPAANRRISKATAAEGNPTNHALYLQEAVDRMTDVFVCVCGIEAVSRISDEGGTRGRYAEFVRATALPLLRAYYPGFSRQRSKLDSQIQTAVARFRGRRR